MLFFKLTIMKVLVVW